MTALQGLLRRFTVRCQRVAGRALASVAVISLLSLQAGMIWHGLEHVLKARTGVASVSVLQASDSAGSPESALCLKCLEDLTHSLALMAVVPSAPAFVGVSVQPTTSSLVRVASPVVVANQRAPPSFLS